MSPKEIDKDMVQIFAEDSPSYATVKKWAAKFKWVRDSTDAQVIQKFSLLNEQVDTIHQKSVGISFSSVNTIVTEILELSKLFVR